MDLRNKGRGRETGRGSRGRRECKYFFSAVCLLPAFGWGTSAGLGRVNGWEELTKAQAQVPEALTQQGA